MNILWQRILTDIIIVNIAQCIIVCCSQVYFNKIIIFHRKGGNGVSSLGSCYCGQVREMFIDQYIYHTVDIVMWALWSTQQIGISDDHPYTKHIKLMNFTCHVYMKKYPFWQNWALRYIKLNQDVITNHDLGIYLTTDRIKLLEKHCLS